MCGQDVGEGSLLRALPCGHPHDAWRHQKAMLCFGKGYESMDRWIGHRLFDISTDQPDVPRDPEVFFWFSLGFLFQMAKG